LCNPRWKFIRLRLPTRTLGHLHRRRTEMKLMRTRASRWASQQGGVARDFCQAAGIAQRPFQLKRSAEQG
jgi:hypothetical protein